MEITEVRIKLVTGGNDKLRAFCSITIDNDFVIRDLKIIEGTKGPFVAMPSRKLMQRCPRCGGKNPYRAHYCNDCGGKLPQARMETEISQRMKLHADIAHPINSRCREIMQTQILEEYSLEMERASQPGYDPPTLDIYERESMGGSMEASFRRTGGPSNPEEVREHAAEEFVEGPGESTFTSAGRMRGDPGRPRGGGPRRRRRRESSGRGSGQPDRSRESREEPFIARSRGGLAEPEGRLEGVDSGGERRSSGAEGLYGADIPEETASPTQNRIKEPSGGLPPGEEGDGFDGDSFRKKRRIREEVETEPEDNFGAGIFS